MQAFRCLSDFGKLVYLQHEHKRDKSIKSQYENLYIGASLGSIKSWLIATWSGWETTYKTARPISSGSKIFVFPLPSYCSRAYSNVQIWGKLEHKRNGTAAASARKEASLWVIVVAVSRFWDDCEVLETMYSSTTHWPLSEKLTYSEDVNRLLLGERNTSNQLWFFFFCTE